MKSNFWRENSNNITVCTSQSMPKPLKLQFSSQVASDGLSCPHMTLDCLNWQPLASIDINWPQVASTGLGWPIIA